jgi:hypothetical protein
MKDNLAFHPPRWVLLIFRGLVLLGGAAFVAGLFWAPQRAWANVFLVSNYLIGLALGGLVIVALHYVTGARWSVPLRRLPEALTAALHALFFYFARWPTWSSGWPSRGPLSAIHAGKTKPANSL